MSPRAVRRVVIVVCAAGIAGMIVASVADNNAAALTAGLVTAAASLCLMVATAVTATPDPLASGGHDPLAEGALDPEGLAQEVERRIGQLVAAGVEEDALRALVRSAVRLGRARP